MRVLILKIVICYHLWVYSRDKSIFFFVHIEYQMKGTPINICINYEIHHILFETLSHLFESQAYVTLINNVSWSDLMDFKTKLKWFMLKSKSLHIYTFFNSCMGYYSLSIEHSKQCVSNLFAFVLFLFGSGDKPSKPLLLPEKIRFNKLEIKRKN